MTTLPVSDKSLLIRTDFSDEAAWTDLCERAQAVSDQGFQACVECVSDPAYDGMSVAQLLALAARDGDRTFVFIADQPTFTSPERPVLVVDVHTEPGRTFRVTPQAMWCVENNLSIANMDYAEFADNTDADGIFRGFPST